MKKRYQNHYFTQITTHFDTFSAGNVRTWSEIHRQGGAETGFPTFSLSKGSQWVRLWQEIVTFGRLWTLVSIIFAPPERVKRYYFLLKSHSWSSEF